MAGCSRQGLSVMAIVTGLYSVNLLIQEEKVKVVLWASYYFFNTQK